MVSRVYVEKKPGFDVEAQQLLAELHTAVPEGLAKTARSADRLTACDVEAGIDEELFERCIPTVFSEPQVDDASRKFPVAGVEFSGKTAWQLAAEGADISGIAAAPANVHVFAVEALPGQFDQRADSASQCIQFISQGERPDVAFTQVYVIEGECTDDALAAVKHYVINPVETPRRASLRAKRSRLPDSDAQCRGHRGFSDLDEAGLSQFIEEARSGDGPRRHCGFASSISCGRERRPTITETATTIPPADHCRYTHVRH